MSDQPNSTGDGPLTEAGEREALLAELTHVCGGIGAIRRYFSNSTVGYLKAMLVSARKNRALMDVQGSLYTRWDASEFREVTQ